MKGVVPPLPVRRLAALTFLIFAVAAAGAAAAPVAPGEYDVRVVEAGFAAGAIAGGTVTPSAPLRITVPAGASAVALPPPPASVVGAGTPISGPGVSGTITPALSFGGSPSVTLNTGDGSASGAASAWLELAFAGTIVVPTSFTCTAGSALSPVALAPSTASGAAYDPATGRLTIAQAGLVRPALVGGLSCATIDAVVSSTMSVSLTYELTPVPTTPGPAPSGGPAYVPAQAAVSPSARTIPIREDVRLDASASLPPGAAAREYSWQLDGDPEPEITCGPETPVLQASFRTAGTVSAQLTVTDSRGAQTSTSTSLSVTRLGARASASGPRASVLASTLRSVTASVNRSRPMPACVPGDRRTVAAIDATRRGGPPPGCVVKTEARSALVAAVGCLQRARWEEIPAAERGLLTAQIITAWEGGAAPPSVERAVSAQGFDRGFTEAALHSVIEDVVWIADPGTTVRINGLDYTPTPRGTVVIIEPGLLSKTTPWVLSARAEVTAPTSVGRVLLRPRESLAIPARKQGFRIASIPVTTGVAFLPGTRLQGTVDVTLEQDRSRLRTRLRLPDDFAWATGAAVSAEAQMIASNKDGIELDGFGIENVDAEILGVGVRIDYLRYVASQRRFEGRAKVSFFQPLGAIDATMHVRDKTIELLDISYFPGAPGIKVAPGVFLSEVNGFYENSPQVLRFGGGAAFTGGPSAGQGCGLVTARGTLEFRIDPKPITVTVDGTGSLVCIPLLRARAQIAADGYVSVGAGIDYELGPLRLKAGWDIRYYDQHFTAEAQAQGCLGDLGCATGSALVSDRGLAFCAEFGPVDAGAGLNWPPGPSLPAIIANLSVMASGCDVGPWRTVVARPAQSDADRTVVVSGRGAVLGIVGGERAPRLRLQGPGDRVIEMPEQGPFRSERGVAFRVPQQRTTFVVLTEPGTWKIETIDGTSVTEVRRAPVLAEPEVRGSVEASGAGRKLLRYAVDPIPGQRVRFFERAGDRLRLIGAAGGKEGALTFTPLDVPSPARRIVAAVEQAGRPRDELTVARFSFAPPRVGRVTRIRTTRRGSVLRIGFSPAPGAEKHLVGVLLSDGRSLQLRAGPERREVRVPRVAAGTTVQLRVAGVRGPQRGPVVRVRARVR